MFYNFTIIIVINPVHQNFFGLVEMTYRLVHASYSLPKWQAVKLPFFAPWFKYLRSRMNVYTKILYFEWGTQNERDSTWVYAKDPAVNQRLCFTTLLELCIMIVLCIFLW